MNKYLLLEYFEKYLPEKKTIELVSYSSRETKGQSSAVMQLLDNGDLCETQESSGVGLVDAGFKTLINHYGEDYSSLSTISLTDLYFQIDHAAGKDTNLKSKTDIKIEFSNHAKNKSCFSEKTTSMGFTAMSILVKAVEFYINCELLFKRMKFLVEDAVKRNRHDVASQYKYALTQVVEVTNYQEIT